MFEHPILPRLLMPVDEKERIRKLVRKYVETGADLVFFGGRGGWFIRAANPGPREGGGRRIWLDRGVSVLLEVTSGNNISAIGCTCAVMHLPTIAIFPFEMSRVKIKLPNMFF